MVANDLIPVLTRPLFGDQRAIQLRIIIPGICLALMWWLATAITGATVWLALMVYAFLQLGLVLVRQHPRMAAHPNVTARTAIIVDLVFSLAVATEVLAVGSAIFPVCVVIGVRVFSAWRRLTLSTIMPLVILLGYLVTAALMLYTPIIAGFTVSSNWWLLIAGISLCGIAVGSNARQRRELAELRNVLRTERHSREARVSELERTANELRARMREQHLLEEGLRVITSSLSLDEVLQQIVDSTSQTLGRDRIVGTSLSLMVDGELFHHIVTRDGSTGQVWSEALALRTMQKEAPIMINDAIDDHAFAALGHRLRSAVSVPLFVGAGAARGALTVVSAEPAAFSSGHTRHLAAFAAQAEIAIGNAEMHTRMQKQQLLLEAVIRDINDGLVVINDQAQIVLANPIGHQLLAEATETAAIREPVIRLLL
jgi:two-component system, NtrC family, sensor histidine kinase KinB